MSVVHLKATLLFCFLTLCCTMAPSRGRPVDASPIDLAEGLSRSRLHPLRSLLSSTNVRDPAAGPYTVIKGAVLNKPCCVSWGPGRIDCFVRGEASNVLQMTKVNAVRSDWIDLKSSILGEIECLSRKQGTINILAIGITNALLVRSYQNGKWNEWTSLKGRLMEVPSCVAVTETSIFCVLRGGRNGAYVIVWINGRWSRYINRGGSLQSPLTVSSRSAAIVDFFGVGGNNLLFQMSFANKKWTKWSNLGSRRVRGRPVVVSTGSGRIDVFVLSIRNELVHAVFDKSWKNWEDLGGRLRDVPCCLNIEKDIHCFGVGIKSYLYRKSYVDGKWLDWMTAYGAFLESPSCVVSNAAKKEVTCYARGFQEEVVELMYKL